jgi:hypothetical protein
MQNIARLARHLVIPALLAAPTWAHAACLVADPTGTPLNVRLAPYAPIVRTIPNNVAVRVVETTRDRNGEPWVHIVYAASGVEIGWVYRRYLDCR